MRICGLGEFVRYISPYYFIIIMSKSSSCRSWRICAPQKIGEHPLHQNIRYKTLPPRPTPKCPGCSAVDRSASSRGRAHKRTHASVLTHCGRQSLTQKAALTSTAVTPPPPTWRNVSSIPVTINSRRSIKTACVTSAHPCTGMTMQLNEIHLSHVMLPSRRAAQSAD